MKRGEIVVANGRGEFTGKARPFLVVQATELMMGAEIVTVCPITSTLSYAPLVRVPLHAGAETGLQVQSEIEVDLISSIRARRISQVIGHAPAATMVAVDQALRRWLGL
ncbi:type II toxin-antitoxin system PemK/MazF family toxin [Sphingomonas arantia]|uniref:Type II toxin-antitoxin system PemK/MazF family toxin n=1 Tax=Sphingomonas arantia TaxID=1460676 RepID=A0ABW4U0T6_9SPHN